MASHASTETAGFRIAPVQEQIWSEQKGSTLFMTQCAIRCHAPLTADQVARAARRIVSRYEILRTRYHIGDGRRFPLQVILDDLTPAVVERDGSTNSPLVVQGIPGLTGEEPMPLRIELTRLAGNESRLLLSIPTMSGDSRTLLLLAAELIREIQGNEEGDEELLQYTQYAEWSRQFTDEPDEEAVAFWTSVRENRIEPLQLSWRRASGDVAIQSLPLSFEKKEEVLQSLARHLSISISDLLTGLWGGFLSRLGKGNGVEIGCDLHGREFEELAGVVGPIARTIPLIVDGTTGTAADLLKDIAGTLETAREASDFYPFDENEERSGRSAAIEIIDASETESPDHVVEFVRSVRNGFVVKLSCLLHGEGRISAELLFDSSRLDSESTAVIAEMFGSFVRDVVADPERSLGDYPLLDENRLKALHSIWNASDNGSIHEDVLAAIERRGSASPGAVAAIAGGREFTYADLMGRANAVAAALVERNIGRRDVVPICLERSFDAVAAILGIMKSGAAFLPIDPTLPESRQTFMARDSGAKIIVTSEEGSPRFNGVLPTLLLSEIETTASSITAEANPDDPAYVIYTSGSTGTPKGCVIRRRNIAAYVGWGLDYYFSESDAQGHWPLFTSLSFDLTLTSIFCALAHGGSITIFGEEVEMPEVLREIFSPESRVDIVKMTPAQASLLGSIGAKKTNVRAAILGGEQLQRSHVEALTRLNPGIRIFNEYGPTETTIGCTVALIGPEDERITIGEPIAGAQAYVADEEGRLLSPYETGELWIAGDGVGAGYLNRDELTAERFRNDLSFSPGTAYRTGDLARRYPDGRLEYLGRNDDQVKVRGYRVELGEIRGHLLRLEGVKDGLVIARAGENDESELIAYYVPVDNLEEETLRTLLRGNLPEYMIPQYFVPIDAIPLTVNGKPDTASLPDPNDVQEREEYVAPRNETERVVAGIFGSVLGVERIGVHDDFFRHGGHSLRAMRAIARLNMELGTDLKVGAIFEHPTVEGLSKLATGSETVTVERIEPVEEREYYELSDAQRRLWVLEQMEDLGDAYHISGVYDVEGEFDVEAFTKAFEHIVERHEILRTTFHVVDGIPMQRVNGAGLAKVEFIDLRGEADAESAAEKHVRRVTIDPFDLEVGPLIRAAILRNDEGRYRILINLHHIISDGWSVGILIRELAALYRACSGMGSPNLPDLPIQYSDFAVWQHRWLREGRLSESRAYWLKKLAGATPLDLPVDMPRPQHKSYRGATEGFAFDREILAGLQTLASEEKASLFMVLTALFKVLLHRYTGQEEITIGTAIAGRDHADLENQVGFYVNVLPLRSTVPGDETFGDLLARVRETATDAYAHQSYPFDRLIDELGVERETGRSPLFDVFLVLQNNESETLRFGDALLTERPLPNTPNKYDLSFDFTEGEEGLRCEVNYNSDIFLPERIRNLIAHLTVVTKAILSESGKRASISSLALVPKEEIEKEIRQFDEELERTLPQLIDEVALRHPKNRAILYKNIGVTYDQLRTRSNGIAALLRERLDASEGTNDRVVVLLPRTELIPLLFLGILKAGGTYVPIDPEYPKDRIKAMLENCGARLIVTDAAGREFAEEGMSVVSVEEIEKAERRTERPCPDGSPEDVAVIIYTSGSTGRPKGVMMEHRGLINAGLGIVREMEIPPYTTNILQFASLSFDASVCEMLIALLHGASLVIVPRTIIDDPRAFTGFIEKNNVGVAILPPAYLATLNKDPLPSLKAIITAGEPPVVDDAIFYAGTRIYFNAYGPSECSICATHHKVEPDGNYPMGMPIGKAIPNIRVLILDRYGNPLPAGLDGELCIMGIGTGPGYLDEEQTRKAFFEHPLFPGERIYRTGDIARRLFDGNILFRGRLDNQVKVRGHRVEPEEIATALQEHPSLIDAAVVARRKSGESVQLVACVVSADDDLNLTELRSWLSDRLPVYMVPSYFFAMEELPTTPNGKIDRVKLLAHAEESIGSESPAEGGREPRTEEERALTEAVAEVLGLEQVSPDDNYFMIGGDSIKAIQLTWGLRERGYTMPVREIFAHPILAEAATRLRRENPIIEEGAVEGEVPLTPIQHWFFENSRGTHRDRFNQSVLLQSTKGKLDVEKLASALEVVAGRHDMLRASFDLSTEPPRQVVSAESNLSLDLIDLTASDVVDNAFEEELVRTHASIAISTEPLLKAKVIRTSDGDYLHLVAHHLIVDVVSWHVLVTDLISAYRGIEEGREVSFPPKTASYRTWSGRLQSYARSEEIGEASRYWRHVGESHASAGVIAVDDSAPNICRDAASLTVMLDAEKTRQLLSEIHEAYNTEARDILLAALGEGLRRETESESCMIALEGHGRSTEQMKNLDVSRTVGWFTSLYPVLLRAGRDQGHAIKETKEMLRSVPMEGLSYGLCRYLMPGDVNVPDLLSGPTQIVLNYLGVEGDGGLDDFFRLESEPEGIGFAPEGVRPFEIEILASVRDGEFHATFTWGKNRIERERIERLAEGWIAEIERTIAHALEVESPELTPSDVDYAGLSIDDLDDILSSIAG